MPDQDGQCLAAVVTAQAADAPEVPWLEGARTDRVVTRAELAAVVEQWRTQGLAGHRVALLAADPVAFGVLFVALISGGSTVVPLDAAAPPEALRQLVDASATTTVVVVGDQRPPQGVTRVLHASGTTMWPRAPRETGSPQSAQPPEVADGASLLFSSGSTGPRKAVRLPEAQLLHVARSLAQAHGLEPLDRGFNSLSLHHVNGEVVGLLAPLVSGGTVVLDGRFHRTGFWDLVGRRATTWVNAVPSIIAILANEPPGPVAPSSLRFVRSASAPLSPAVMARFEERYGVPVIESYGMTEAASQITANPLHDRRPGTVGKPVGVELRVLDEQGADAAPGRVGRVVLRGPGVIPCYASDVGADRFDAEGWLDTEDLGSYDLDGYPTLTGREGDVINRGGEKVFPREVEDVLRGHPAAAEAVVIGRADPVLGEVAVAYVVPTQDAPPDLAEQLTARGATALPRERRPVEIRLVAEVPHGPTGKPVRRLVAAQDRESLAAVGVNP